MTEQQLLERYVTIRREVSITEDNLKCMKERMNEAEEKLISYMEENGITSTAKYETLGRLAIVAPMLRVNIEPGLEDTAFMYLESIGESAAVRKTIHWKTLAAIMKDKVEKNEPLPECFKVYFQQQTRYEEPK